MTEKTGAPTDLEGGRPATESPASAATAETPASGTGATTATPVLDDRERATFTAIADQLIPSADGMPSAADVVTDDRLAFVLRARPDLAEPIRLALRADLGEDVQRRLATLADEPTNLAALQLAIVGGYYTDRRVRELIGYPGQLALELRSWEYPPYLEEGLIDAVLARGPVWRDPSTGQRARIEGLPRSYAERYATAEGRPDTAEGRPEGGNDGRDGA
jgi:hypothetical protein